MEDVYLKIIVINQTYSTRINTIDIVPFARHIAGLGMDKLIAEGSLIAVARIIDCPPLRRHYSFATKFCNWHNHAAYPIYDRNADGCLWAYQKQDKFGKFHRQDLWDYAKFVDVVTDFRGHYGLEEFNFKELDKFLWLTGYKIGNSAQS